MQQELGKLSLLTRNFRVNNNDITGTMPTVIRREGTLFIFAHSFVIIIIIIVRSSP